MEQQKRVCTIHTAVFCSNRTIGSIGRSSCVNNFTLCMYITYGIMAEPYACWRRPP